MTTITDPLAIYNAIRDDQRAEDNPGRYQITMPEQGVYRVTDRSTGRHTDCDSMTEACLLVEWAEALGLPERSAA